MSTKSAFVVIAEFTVRPERMAEFLAACRDDAENSVAHEPGCISFDAVVPEDASDHVVLYEVYLDRAAFDAHLATTHYARFAQAADEMTSGKVVRFASRVG